MDHFFVITNKPKDEQLRITNRIISFFRKNGKTCDYRYLEEIEQALSENAGLPESLKESDCILVIGGDGTMLKAAHHTLDMDIPLLGINYGTLGFLAEVEKGNLEDALFGLLHTAPEMESRMMLEGKLSFARQGKDAGAAQYPQTDHALNDIVLTRPGTLQILCFDLYVNGQYLNHFSADGVIVSTPTGSTGYNLSAGGPIVQPGAELLLVTPICPHTLNTRSIVLAPTDLVEVRIPIGKNGREQEVEVNFDGSQKMIIRTGDSIYIKKSEKETKLLRINKVSFLEVLHKKMSE